MYANPKNNIRRIIFLVIANVILIFVMLLLFSWVLKWDLRTFFGWIPLVNQPSEEYIIEREIDPLIIEKSDMDKHEEYLNAKEQKLNLREKELEKKEAELLAYESELITLKDTLDKERELFEKQKNAFSTEEERYREAATQLYNMNTSSAVEIISNEEINLHEVINILLTLNKMAEEQNRQSITPVLLQEMASSDDENKKTRATQIIDWIAKYEFDSQ